MSDRTTNEGYEPVAAVIRNEFPEGLHFGRVLALHADGSDALVLGDVDAPVLPRSANKLMQAAAMRANGLQLDSTLTALSAASHWGEAKHIDGVRAILASVGLDESALQTTPGLPEDEAAKRAAICADVAGTPLLHNCSGKHAAMLATCVVNEWDIAGYLSPEHPLQVALRTYVEQVIEQPVAHTSVDGCGAPAWAMSLRSLAGAFRLGALSEPSSPLRQVADAMREHPEYVCGEASEVTGLMRAVPGLLAKDGAESVYAGAFGDGRAVVVKIADGGFRAGQTVFVAALRAMGADDIPGADSAALDQWGTVPVRGHGVPIGQITPVGALAARLL